MVTHATRKTSAITIGPRYRKDIGDLTDLIASINDVGLLHAIVITPSDVLIAGERRLRAWEKTKYAAKEIPVRIVDLNDVLRGEYEENAVRKDFTPSEQVAIMRALTPVAKAEAKERQRAHAGTAPGRKNTSGNFPEVSKSQSREQVAALVGKSYSSLNHAEIVVAAAEADPAKYGPVVEEMDRTGNISAAYRKVSALQGRRRNTKAKAPKRTLSVAMHPGFSSKPSGTYMTIVVDEIHPNLTAAALKPLVAAHCVMWVWDNGNLPETVQLFAELGFSVQRMFVWPGHSKRRSEACLIATHGEPPSFRPGPLMELNASAGRWSRPVEFFTLVERHCRSDRFLQYGGENPMRSTWDYLDPKAKDQAA